MAVNLSDLAEIVPGGGSATPETARPGMSLADLHETDPNPRGPGPQTLGQEFRRGVQAGTNQMQTDLFGLAHLTGSLIGSDTLKDWALEGIDNAAGDAELLQPTVSQMSDIEDGGDFFQWAAGAIGQQIPVLATMLGSGGLTGAVTKTAMKGLLRRAVTSAGRRALASRIKGLSTSEMTRLLAGQLDDPATQRLLRQSFSRGAGYGAGAASFAIQAGDLQNQLTQAGLDSPGTAVLGGALAAALDAAPAVTLLNRMFPGVDTKLAKTFVTDMAEAIGEQFAMEGGTEGAQEMIMLASQAYHDPSFDISSPINRKRVLNAAAAGALVGGLTGGAGNFIPAATRPVARNVRVAADKIGAYARTKLEASRLANDNPTDTGGISELRKAATDFFYQEVAPVLNSARTNVSSAVAAVQAGLGVENIGLNASKIADDADTRVRENVNPLMTRAIEVLHQQVGEAKEQAKNLLGAERVTFLQNKLDSIRADIKSFVDKRIKPLMQKAKKETAEGLSAANYDDDEIDFDEPSEEAGRQATEVEETRIGPSGRTFKRTVVGESEQISVSQEDAEVNEPRKIVFGDIEQRSRSVKSKKTGEVSTTTVNARTRGDTAKPMTKADADTAAENLRKLMPTVKPESINVEKQGDGYVVTAEDVGNADEIYDNIRFLDGLVDAAAGSRLNPEVNRRIEVQQPGRKGATRMDLPTLVLAGEDLAQRAGMELPENRTKRALIGLDTILAKMIDQGYTFPDSLKTLHGKMLFETDGKPVTVDRAREYAKWSPEQGPAVRERQLNIEQGIEPMPKADKPVFDTEQPQVQETQREGFRKGVKRSVTRDTEPVAEGEGQMVDRPNVSGGVEQTEEDLLAQNKRNPNTRTKRQRPQRAKEVFVHVDSASDAEAEKLGEFVANVKKLAGLKNRIILVDDAGIARLAEENPGDYHIQQANLYVQRQATLDAAEGRDKPGTNGFIMPYGNEAMIYIGNHLLVDKEHGDVQRAKHATYTVLAHELGHLIEFVYYRQIKDDKLRQAIHDDYLQYVKEDGKLPFEEWMANQFAKWMTVDAEPRTVVEKFFDKVATIMKKVYDQMRKAIGLGPGYQKFAQGIVDHAAGRTNSTNPYAQHFFNEGIVGRIFFKGVEAGKKTDAAGLQAANFDVKDVPQKVRNKVTKLLSDYPGARQAGVRLWETVSYLHDQFAASLNGKLRRMGLKAAVRLADIFNRTPGTQRTDSTYFNTVQMYSGIFESKFIEAVRGMTESEKQAALGILQSQTPRAQLTGHAAAIAKVFDEMYEYAREAGLPIRKVSDYFPRVWDIEAVREKKDQIVEKLISLGLKPDAAEEVYSKMAGMYHRTVENPENELDIPFEGFLQKRAQVLDDEFFNEFQTTDLDQTIIQYMRGLIKRAEFNRHLGMDYRKANKTRKWNPRGTYDSILKEAKEEGATPEQLDDIHKAVDAMLGRYGRDLPRGVRTAMAWIVTYQNLRLLAFSVLSAFPDIIGPAIRSNDWKGTFRTFKQSVGAMIDKGSDLNEMARTWGIISDSLNQHVLTENFDNHWFPESARKINEKFFRYTGLEKWTNFVRSAALAVGRDFIKRRAVAAQDGDTKAVDDLAQLGLTAADVLDWTGDGERVFGSGENTSEADKRVAEALIQFVNESVMRPDPSQRPLWASNPAFMLLFHLKSFMYAFHNTVARQVYQNFKDAGTPWQKAFVVAGPALMMMAVTALGLELRELIQYKLWGKAAPTDNQSASTYIGNLVLRSGLYGPAQMAIDLESADKFGQLPMFGAAGPTIQQMNDILSKPLSTTVPKAIPVLSQMPAWRQALRDLGD